MRRRFRFSNYQSTTKVRPFACSVPLALKPGWNQMQLNLANFTMRAYGTNYLETQRVQIHANCRIRRVYFSDKLYTEEELPRDYRIYLNVRQSQQLQQPPREPPRASVEKTEEFATSSILKQAEKPGDADLTETKPEIEPAVESFKSESMTKSIVEEAVEGEESRPKDKKTKSVVSINKFKMSKVGSKSSLAEHPSKSKLGKKSTTSIKSKTSHHVRSKSTLVQQPIEVEEIELARTSIASLKSIPRLPSSELPAVEEGAVPEEAPIAEESDVEGQAVEPVPEISGTEGEITDESELESPRTEVTDSEYQESEPAPESDVEQPPPPESAEEEEVTSPEAEQATE